MGMRARPTIDEGRAEALRERMFASLKRESGTAAVDLVHWFQREDCPEVDNRNWLKWITLQDSDGEMTTSVEDIPIEKYPLRPCIPGRKQFLPQM